ncbi:MAG: Rv3235 family protein [Actinomycetaceae bacterium]|nr:Rv3235 family protein [Actinomycetaceae bacterium]
MTTLLLSSPPTSRLAGLDNSLDIAWLAAVQQHMVPSLWPSNSEDELPLSSDPLPDVGPWARGMAQGLIEALAGARPVTQFQRWLSPGLYDYLDTVVARKKPNPGGASACQARAVRLCHLPGDIVEAAVVVSTAHSRHVVALRLEGRRGRWITTALNAI